MRHPVSRMRFSADLSVSANLVVLHAHGSEFLVGHDHAAHHHDPGGDGREFVFQAGKFFAGIHGLDEEGFQFLAGALRFGQRERRCGGSGDRLVPDRRLRQPF